MKGIEVLYWALSILICLSMVFAILLWCRSWRREEREETEKQIRALYEGTARLSASMEMMEHTFASLEAADEQFSRQIEDLRDAVQRLRTSVPLQPVSQPPVLEVSKTEESHVVSSDPDSNSPEKAGDQYAQARTLLTQGQSALDVARTLEMGSAEVNMIARMMNSKSEG